MSRSCLIYQKKNSSHNLGGQRTLRVFSGLPPITLDSADVAEIVWEVHLANRRAAFFEFNGQQGAEDDFAISTLRNSNVDSGILLEIIAGQVSNSLEAFTSE